MVAGDSCTVLGGGHELSLDPTAGLDREIPGRYAAADLQGRLCPDGEPALIGLSRVDTLRAICPSYPPPVDGPSPVSQPSEPGPELTHPADSGELLADAYQREVITASRHAQSPLDSPSSISVLDRNDIQQSGATKVPDLLRRMVGVEVMSLSAAQPDVSIRGFNREMSNKVLVLVDGRTVYWDIWGTALWSTLSIPLAAVERVEVIRGPGGAVYGANAVTGVINIITRDPGEPLRLFQAEVGTPGYTQETMLVSGREGGTWMDGVLARDRGGRMVIRLLAPFQARPVRRRSKRVRRRKEA